MNVYTREDFFSPEECSEIQWIFPGLTPGEVVGKKSAARKSRIAFATTTDHPLIRRLRAQILSVNDRMFKFEIMGHESLQLAEYSQGEHYDWHLDLGPGANAKRKLSASIQLTDPDTYDGGDLEFWGGAVAERRQGTLVMFPSYMLHRVKPVTRGVRKSLVAWSFGALPYR